MLFTVVVVAYIPHSLAKLTDRTNTHAHTVRTVAGKIRTHTSITILFFLYEGKQCGCTRVCECCFVFVWISVFVLFLLILMFEQSRRCVATPRQCGQIYLRWFRRDWRIFRVLLSTASLSVGNTDTFWQLDVDDCLNSIILRQHRKQDKMFVCVHNRCLSDEKSDGRNGHDDVPPPVDWCDEFQWWQFYLLT